MHLRVFLPSTFLVFTFALPLVAHAGIPFFGPIIPSGFQTCAAGWGMLLIVVNNVISLLLTLAIVFVTPIMIAWAGFLFVVNPANPSGIGQAKSILSKTILGLVIALSAWLIVNAIMVGLTTGSNGFGRNWVNLIRGDPSSACLQVSGAPYQPGAPLPPIIVTPPPTTCSISPLSPITDSLAQQMESGQTVIWDSPPVDPRLRPCVDKFRSMVGGTVTSVYRPQPYQTHLYEIRNRWCTADLRNNTVSACSTLKSTVSAEVTKHFGFSWSCGAVGQTSNHTSGIAVDISGLDPSNAAVQNAAQASCLSWRNLSGDPYHWELRSSCTCQ